MTEASTLLFAAPLVLLGLAMAMHLAAGLTPKRKPARIAARRDDHRR